MGNRKIVHNRILDTGCVDGYKKESNSSVVSGRGKYTRIRNFAVGRRRSVDFSGIRRTCRSRISAIISAQPTRNWVWRQFSNLKFRCFFRCVETICSTYDCIRKCVGAVWNRVVEKETKKNEPCAVCTFFVTRISRCLDLVRRECRGSTIVEMAYLIPVILLMWMLVIFALFYYHDKTLVIGATYETVAVGGEWYEEADEVETEKIGEYFQNRIRGKLLFYSYISADVQMEEDLLIVDASARKRGMRIHVVQKIKIRNPKKEIRRIQIIKDGLEDLKE